MLYNVYYIKTKTQKLLDSENAQVFEIELGIMIWINEEFTINENLENRRKSLNLKRADNSSRAKLRENDQNERWKQKDSSTKASLTSHTKFEFTESIHLSNLLKTNRHSHLNIQEKEYITSIAKRSLEGVHFAWRWYSISASTMRRIINFRLLW